MGPTMYPAVQIALRGLVGFRRAIKRKIRGPGSTCAVRGTRDERSLPLTIKRGIFLRQTRSRVQLLQVDLATAGMHIVYPNIEPNKTKFISFHPNRGSVDEVWKFALKLSQNCGNIDRPCPVCPTGFLPGLLTVYDHSLERNGPGNRLISPPTTATYEATVKRANACRWS